VVSDRCTLCHSGTPKFGAPMPLMRLQDFRAAAKSDVKRVTSEVILERISTLDPSRRMPPTSSSALTSAELGSLSTWINSGTPVTGGDTCAITEPSAVASNGPSPTTGASNTPYEYDDPLLQCYKFAAHAPDDMARPYDVDETPDNYVAFTFAMPWKEMMYARAFKVVLGNSQIIHHWVFYQDNEFGTDGEVKVEDLGLHPDGTFIQGWAPGGTDFYLSPDLGQEMPGDVTYTLEAHYNNGTGGTLSDTSGMELCVTPTKPEKIAGVSWLGTDLIVGDTRVTATCRPDNTEPIHILGGTPHMHKTGKRMKLVINRDNGDDQLLIDEAFDFNYQHTFPFQEVLMPGDHVTTTCYYTEPAVYGYGSADEMCYAFIWYYPKPQLTNGNPLGEIHGPNTCLD
jgi:hypothetical protein